MFGIKRRSIEGKANVLQTFKNITSEFIVLNFNDPNFSKKAMKFMCKHQQKSSGFMLRSANTCEGLFPVNGIGRTFAGLFESVEIGINDPLNPEISCNIEAIKNHLGSVYLKAIGKMSFNDLSTFDKLSQSWQKKLGDLNLNAQHLKKYAEARGVDLSKHKMQFILQVKVEGTLFHAIEHPNFRDMYYLEKEGSNGDNVYGLSTFLNKSTDDLEKLFNSLDFLDEQKKILSQLVNRAHTVPIGKKCIEKIKEIKKNLNQNFSYLYEFIVIGNPNNNDVQVIPVQATPIFKSVYLKLDNIQRYDLDGFQFLLNDFSQENVSMKILTDSEKLSEALFDLTSDLSNPNFLIGKALVNVNTNSVLSHISARLIEGSVAYGKERIIQYLKFKQQKKSKNIESKNFARV